MLAAGGLTGLLAGCGSFGGAPDGTNAVMRSVTTEYKVAGSNPTKYVGCDRITNPTDGRATNTQVVVTFSAAGNLSTVDVSLVGVRTGQTKTQTIAASDLRKNSAGDYQAIFDFQSATNDLLPASIIVNPTLRSPRDVTVNDANNVGQFYANLTVSTTSGSTFTITSKNLGPYIGNISVYSSCTLSGTAQPLTR